MFRFHPNEARHALRGGVVAGAAAGAILTVMMVTMSFARGNDVWYGIKGAAQPVLGDRAMLPGFDLMAVLLGFAIHIAISIAWAIPFAFVVLGLKRLATIAVGAAWGVLVWFGMYYVVLPLVGLETMVDDAPISRAIAYHLFFGVALALTFLPFQRPTVRSRAPRPSLA